MGMEEIGLLIEADNRARVYQETWGHLRPKPRQIYNGHVLFTLGCFGDITVIDFDFGELESSPWFYRALHDYIGDFVLEKKHGGVWRFDGYVRAYKNGTIRFHGKIRPMRIQYRFKGKQA